jgi:hypothetical protein
MRGHINPTFMGLSGHQFRLNQFALGGGGDQGDLSEGSTHPKPPGASCRLDLLELFTRYMNNSNSAAMDCDDWRAKGSEGK